VVGAERALEIGGQRAHVGFCLSEQRQWRSYGKRDDNRTESFVVHDWLPFGRCA
jgi:hypothetical protein